MTEPATYTAHFDLAKYTTTNSPASAPQSVYGSESPLAATASTTTASSSRLSGSYEPSQVGSYMEDMSAQMAHLAVGESPLPQPVHPQSQQQQQQQQPQQQPQQPQPHPQRPQLSHIITSPTNTGRPTSIHAPYSNFHSYPNYYPASPVVRDHPQYPYSPEQHQAVPTPYFPTPLSPPPPPPQVQPAAYHPQMVRRPSYGGYYTYEYAPTPPVQSPVTPYAYGPPSSMVFIPPSTPTQAYPTQASPQPGARQARPAVPSPLRPSIPAPSAPSTSSPAAPTTTTTGTGSGSTRRPNNPLYASASSFGHQASLLYRRTDQPTPSSTVAAPRSAVLTDFKNQKFKRFELKDIFGHCVEFSVDQHGSRFIQQKLDVASVDERQVVFDEIVPTGQALRLMKDVFGNYVIQKLFEYGNAIQKALLCGVVQGNVLQLSLDMYGCRVIQKAIECTSLQQQSALVAELGGHILQCVKDSNGNHVIQKLLERVVPERQTFVNAFTENVFHLATHPYGCRVLQRCFEHASAEQVAPLLGELHQNAAALMQDQFGNYVIQFVLERGSAHDRNRMIDALTGQLSIMSRHKFASNVCEKAMTVADPGRRRRIVEEMLAPTSTGLTLVAVMMKDQYANYVLQKAINLVDGDLLDSLIAVVLPQFVAMRRHPSTANSKQLNSIERLLREKGFPVDQALHPPTTMTAAVPQAQDATL